MRWTVSGNVAGPLLDLGHERLRDMDIAGVDLAVLSLTSPGLQNLPVDEAVALQGPTNDVIAQAVRQHPDRFRGFATLATPDPAAAAAEVERAVSKLGLDGILLHTLSGDEFHDLPKYWDIFAAAEAHRVPIYLHPSLPASGAFDAYYDGFGLLGTGAPGWHYQTGIAVLRMIIAGVFDRFPGLQVIIGHWGEMVLFFLDRIQLLTGAAKLQRPLVEYFQNNVHITPGGIASHRYLNWAIEVIGADRIMHATDYPFNSATDFAARDFLDTAALTDTDRRQIASDNWERLVSRIIR
ncbi:amidohydrolase family protein [Frondihabitans sp. PAMC 28766]|uniref:amidohydrolase family protein n=1 Tax=Frondihabitans sp. PAMC 28766 TaxID=1795630 RepID=UPI0012FF6B14|nr:amidohydrolase family protein [Frondihabitans sp. PAMC 28766]